MTDDELIELFRTEFKRYSPESLFKWIYDDEEPGVLYLSEETAKGLSTSIISSHINDWARVGLLTVPVNIGGTGMQYMTKLTQFGMEVIERLAMIEAL